MCYEDSCIFVLPLTVRDFNFPQHTNTSRPNSTTMKFNLLKRCFLFLTLPTLALTAAADVTLPPVLGSGMVLQRDLPVPVWGWADAGEKISVTFAGQTKTAKAGDDGK